MIDWNVSVIVLTQIGNLFTLMSVFRSNMDQRDKKYDQMIKDFREGVKEEITAIREENRLRDEAIKREIELRDENMKLWIERLLVEYKRS